MCMQTTTASVTDELRIDSVAPDGTPRVERKHVVEDTSTTIAHSLRVSSELAAFVTGDGVDVADLPADIQAWVRAETEDKL